MGIGKIKFIDLSGVNIDTTAETGPIVSGIYKTLTSAVGKMIVLANLTVDGVVVGTTVVSPKEAYGDDITCEVAGHAMFISPEDEIFVNKKSFYVAPAIPEADGDYTLACSVEDGVPTLSWVASGD